MVTIKTREQWGARAPKGTPNKMALPSKSNYLHHTAGSEAGVSGMRAIQNFHMDSRGWNDIGYSWVYDKDERTWYEGRGWGVVGAHTGGYNSIAHGYCVMGNFNNEPVTKEMIYDIAWMIAEAYKRGKGPAKFTGGHRDVSSTSCPGDNLYNAIPLINNKVAAILAGDDTEVEVWPTSVLGIGDKDGDVYFLQRKLNETGWVSIAVDGDFGPNTEKAVKTAQSKLGVTVDGIVGPNTWGALEAHFVSLEAPEPVAPEPVEPEPEPEPTDWAFPEHANRLLEAGIYSKWTGPGYPIDTDNLSAYIDRLLTKAAGLVRIDGESAVFQICGEYLVPVTSPAQAKVIVLTAGGAPSEWQKYVTDITAAQAAAFIKVESGAFLTSGGAAADHVHDEYAPSGHSHDNSYAKIDHGHQLLEHTHPATEHSHKLTFTID